MALQHSSPHLGDIGDQEQEPEVDPDRGYEQEIESQHAETGRN